MSTLTKEALQEKLATDAAFRAEFIANPRPVLAQIGLIYPDATAVHVVETGFRDVALIIGGEGMYPEEQLKSMPPQMSAVITRSFVDPGFKALLLSNPVEALFLEVGYRVPDGSTVRTYEATDKDAYFLIFDEAKPLDAEELSDLELEQVSGGGGVTLMTDTAYLNPQPLPPMPIASSITCMTARGGHSCPVTQGHS